MQTRRFARSRHDRMLGGVLGGAARYFGMNSTLLRVLYVVGSVVSVAFPGIVVYVLLWLVVPEDVAS